MGCIKNDTQGCGAGAVRGGVTPSSSKNSKRRAMKIESLRVNYIEDGEESYIAVMQGERMLVGLHGDQAKEIYRCLTDQGYAMERVKHEVEQS